MGYVNVSRTAPAQNYDVDQMSNTNITLLSYSNITWSPSFKFHKNSSCYQIERCLLNGDNSTVSVECRWITVERWQQYRFRWTPMNYRGKKILQRTASETSDNFHQTSDNFHHRCLTKNNGRMHNGPQVCPNQYASDRDVLLNIEFK